MPGEVSLGLRPGCGLRPDRGERVGHSMPQQIHAPARLLVLTILLAALFHAPSVRAEIRVSGEPAAVRIEAHDARIDEVMGALRESFGLNYRGPASLGRRITGKYDGSLQGVVARLLDGYDFVIKTDSESVEVWVYGSVKSEAASLPPRPVTATTPTPVEVRREARRKRHAM